MIYEELSKKLRGMRMPTSEAIIIRNTYTIVREWKNEHDKGMNILGSFSRFETAYDNFLKIEKIDELEKRSKSEYTYKLFWEPRPFEFVLLHEKTED